MAKKGKVQNGAFGDYRFVNVNLDKADKDWLQAADLAKEFPVTELLGMVQEGYKVSLSEDPANSSFVCSATDRREGSPSEKCILTGRGSTPIDAWYAFCYKHIVKCGGDWLPFVKDTGGGIDQWG